MYELINPMTYGQAADVLNRCDEDDIPIYIVLTDLNKNITKFPIDNFQMFKEVTGHDINEMFPFSFSKDDDAVYIGN